jgi:predicted ABC-type ATPase
MTSDINPTPSIYIIAGPNGAGKTTFANRFLPDYAMCSEFLNADLIAAGLSPFAPEQQSFLASELMLQRMRELLEARKTFSFETTLAARSYVNRIPEWQADGYKVSLFFLWLPSVEMAIERVANRVRQGGHGIPEPTIRQRYQRGLENFHHRYRPAVDEWILLDNSQVRPQEIARWNKGLIAVSDETKWQRVQP